MTNLQSKYLGLKLKNPLVASASPLSKDLDNIKKMEDAGVSAVVMYSLFEEEIVHESLELDYFLDRGTESYPEALSYFPKLEDYNLGKEKYLKRIRAAKENVDIPVIGSLNGVSSSGWTAYASQIEAAGADALELNLYFVPTNPEIDAQQQEENYVQVINNVRKEIQIPLAVKLSPFFSSLPNFAEKAVKAGADGLVLFNRFYQPDLDVNKLEVTPWLELSDPIDMLLPLRWIAILYDKVRTDFALTSGVHSGRDMVKAVMAGASAVMSASELIGQGIDRAAMMLKEFGDWAESHEYESVEQMRGVLSQKTVQNPAAFERANYMKALNSYDNQI